MSNKIDPRKCIKSILASSVIALVAASGTAIAMVQDGASEKYSSDSQQLSQRLIIKYKADMQAQNLSRNAATALDSMLSNSNFNVGRERLLGTGNHIVEVAKDMSSSDINSMVKQLKSHADIEDVYLDLRAQILFTPDDSRYSEQWHYFEAVGGANLPPAWDLSTGSDVVVAVIDTGFRPHADLVSNLLPGYDMISDVETARDGDLRDPDASDEGDWYAAGECSDIRDSPSSWHGTHVAGTIAAQTNNATGVAGTAFNAKVVPVRALGKCGGFFADISDSIIWAAGGNVPGVPLNPNPAHVINMSLGGRSSCDANTQDAVNIARGLGATIVVAAGNSSEDASLHVPANCQGVITIAATNRQGARAFYSNFGNSVDLAAPGGNLEDRVLSTLNAGATTPASDSVAGYLGTSMAAPHVAGITALMIAANPDLNPDQIETILKNTTRDFPASCDGCGTGIVDAAAAVTAAIDGDNPGPGPDPVTISESNLEGQRRTWQHFEITVPAGAANLSATLSGGSGDADLYVRQGGIPNRSSFDCRSQASDNNEQCDISSPAAGVWYVSVYAYRRYSGLNLDASAQ